MQEKQRRMMLFFQWIISPAGSLLAYQNIYAPINAKSAGGGRQGMGCGFDIF